MIPELITRRADYRFNRAVTIFVRSYTGNPFHLRSSWPEVPGSSRQLNLVTPILCRQARSVREAGSWATWLDGAYALE